MGLRLRCGHTVRVVFGSSLGGGILPTCTHQIRPRRERRRYSYEMTNPALEPVSLSTSRTKIPYCTSTRPDALVVQIGLLYPKLKGPMMLSR